MTIKEYKGKFLDLFEELQKEHGAVRFVHVECNWDDIPAGVPLVSNVTIEF